MSRRKELIALLLGDFIALNLAWFAYYWLRVHSGWFVIRKPLYITPSDLIPSALIVYGMWMLAFLFFGLYRTWYVRPIFDEIVTVLKTLVFGTLAFVLFFLWEPMSDTESPIRNDPRILGLLYFGVTSVLVIGFRLVIRYSQRRFLEAGIGRRPSIIVGDATRAMELAQKVAQYPRLGYDIVGYVSTNSALIHPSESFNGVSRNGSVSEKEIRRLGEIGELEKISSAHKIKEVLIALDSGDHDSLIQIIGRLAKTNVGIKIAPDLYDIVSGQARTREIYGFPLIDINPELQRPWEEAAKRFLDAVVSFLVLLVGMPVWLLTALAVWLTSKGPVIYSQERVGKNGTIFHIYKFRSMRTDAEQSGPQWASKNDPRVTPIGRFLRKSHLDEVPQFWNVLKGDMSLVGPRPEREFFIEKLTAEIPYYTRRLKVRPGITGLYQAMIDKYDENIDDVKDRVRYDLMYIESMSFRLDLKILFRTAYMMFRGRGQA
ncbi:MAG: sugar transferase [Bacteroidota bacterium]|nr:sugar transferase [Bacteroidota bacterium]